MHDDQFERDEQWQRRVADAEGNKMEVVYLVQTRDGIYGAYTDKKDACARSAEVEDSGVVALELNRAGEPWHDSLEKVVLCE